MARFHPSKKLNLAIASSQGAVTVYDINHNRKMYHNTEAHSSPCRDLAMSESLSDIIISVSYDCTVKIFDTRRKCKSGSILHTTPLSTVCLSQCGTYFCVGSLKGELLTGDMRNTKVFLMNKKVHDGRVERVAFVPKAKDTTQSICNSLNSTVEDNELENFNPEDIVPIGRYPSHDEILQRIAKKDSRRDSFCDFMNFQSGSQEKLSNSRESLERLPSKSRLSIDWEAFKRKPGFDDKGKLFALYSN